MTTKQTIILLASVAVAAGGGFAVGYFVGRNHMKKLTDDIINQLNDEVNDYAKHLADHDLVDKVIVEGKDYTDPNSYDNTSADGTNTKYIMTPEQEEAVRRAKALSKKNDKLKQEYMDRIRKEGYKTFTITDEERQKIKDELASMTDEEKLDFVTRDEDDEERIANNEAMNLESDEDYEERMADTEDVIAGSAQYSGLPPYIIDQEDYMNPQFDSFTKQQFTYFGDGTLIDDGDDIVPDPDSCVGLDNLVELEAADTDRIFVRNEGYNADYEIIFKEMSYKEFMGM